jgi:hypothetical protein
VGEGFFRQWKRGAESITPLQQLRAKRYAMLGQLAGMLLAVGYVVWRGPWYWIAFLVFTLVILLIEFLGLHQQVRQIEGR